MTPGAYLEATAKRMSDDGCTHTGRMLWGFMMNGHLRRKRTAYIASPTV